MKFSTKEHKKDELFSLFYNSGVDMNKAGSILARCTKISHLDEVCGIIHLDNNNDYSYKFVVDPFSNKKLNDDLQYIVRRGINHQYNCRNIEGVQRIISPYFYEGIIGLIGPLNYVDGENLKNIGFTENTPKRLKQFQKLEETLNKMHDQNILHRHVKSGNIIESENEDVSFIDFSISATFNEDLGDRSDGWVLGTPQYLHSDSNRSQDFYALGVSFLESILPSVELPYFPNKDQVREFEKWNSKNLDWRYGPEVSEYFLHLINLSPEYDLRITSTNKRIKNTENISINSTVIMPSRMLNKIRKESFSYAPTIIDPCNENINVILETSECAFNCSLLKN